jgi:TPR repeat protein
MIPSTEGISCSIKKDRTMRLIYPVAALVGVLVLSACSHTGSSHSKGQPTAGKSYSLTYEQVREAAQDGDADAQYALGYMYYYGQNVTRNANQARFWIGRAAAQNHQQAIRALKMMDAEPRPTVAQMGVGPRYGAGQNSWQEVRRHSEAVTQPERLTDKTSTQAKVQTTAKTTVKAENESKTVGKKHHRAELHKKHSSKQWAKRHGAHAPAEGSHEGKDSANDVNASSPKVANTKASTVMHSETTTDEESLDQGTQADAPPAAR